VKGLECIKNADVIIYDYLASSTLLNHASENAEIIYVGKKGGDHTLSQQGINALIVKKARQGFAVTRLKGGDPFIFGRGGEEVEALVAENIPFEVVPGVTSAIASPAYAGIPLTHRKFTSTLAFITGHEDPDKARSGIKWESLARGIGTLVFLMGVKNLPLIVKKLLDHGKPKETPVALVRWGTTSRQVTVQGDLGNITDLVKKAGLKAPAVIVVGHVVTLRQKMNWFENQPLLGKTILVTRARRQASKLVDKLSELGARCFECPTIKVVPPDDREPLDQAIENFDEYDWVIFTSVNGVDCFFKRLFSKGRDVRLFGRVHTAVIGPATAKRLADFGLTSDIVPETYRAESVAQAFSNQHIRGKRILIPRAMEARPVLPVELRKMGAVVDEIPAYRTEAVGKENAEHMLRLLEQHSIDIVTFTSSSTVKNFKSVLPPGKTEHLMKNVKVASIGPVTSETAEKLGFHVDITADNYTIDGLVETILQNL
jgi:uroporphyrinogen III methyltransferase/synthase